MNPNMGRDFTPGHALSSLPSKSDHCFISSEMRTSFGRLEIPGCDFMGSSLVCHCKDAIPVGRRFVKEIFLTAFPVHARGSFIGPAVQNLLESVLSFFPSAFAVEFPATLEELEARPQILSRRVSGDFRLPADQLVDGHGLQFALHANQVKLAENEASILRGFVG